MFLDLIKPETGGINLHSDQRTFMRCAMRFLSMYGVFPRGWGKTFNEVLVMFIACVFYPGKEYALTAQTKENAALLLKDKHQDIIKKYPWFKSEIYKYRFPSGDAEIEFVNGSRITVLANHPSSKGQRKHEIMIEESALLNDVVYQDALLPIVEHGRMTVGKYGILNPDEPSQKVNFFTTAGFRGSDEYNRNLLMRESMVNLEGQIVIGSSWYLGCWYNRGSTKKEIAKKKKIMSPVAFAQNFESRWTGSVDGALVDINKLLKLRILPKGKIKNDNDNEYILGVDVARSQTSSNNQSSVAVVEIIRDKQKRIKNLNLVNLFSISGTLNFHEQALEVKKIRKDFKAAVVVVDTNGLGVGLCDKLMEETYDPTTQIMYPCWDTMNTDAKPQKRNAEECIYDLKPQSANSDAIVNFIGMVDSQTLLLIEKKQDANYDVADNDYYNSIVAPALQTDMFIEEVANLQMKNMSKNKVSVVQVVTTINKDRFSAVMYALWYAKNFKDEDIEDEDYEFVFTYS